MKYFLTTILFLFTAIGFAATKETINLNMKLSIDRKPFSQLRILTISGETASITSASDDGDGVFIEVTSTLRKNKEVFMKFIVAELVKGKKTILSRPQVISLLGEQAEITQESTDGPPKSVFLAVTATRN